MPSDPADAAADALARIRDALDAIEPDEPDAALDAVATARLGLDELELALSALVIEQDPALDYDGIVIWPPLEPSDEYPPVETGNYDPLAAGRIGLYGRVNDHDEIPDDEIDVGFTIRANE